MTNILTNDIEYKSFMGLVLNAQKKQNAKFPARAALGHRPFAKIESKEVLRNLAIATVAIVLGLTAGSVSQQKMQLAQYSAQVKQADV